MKIAGCARDSAVILRCASRSVKSAKVDRPSALMEGASTQGESSKMMVVSGVWERASVAVVAVGSRRWRVVRDDQDAAELPPLLGFVQTIGEVFESTTIGQPLVRRYWPDLSSAVVDVCEQAGVHLDVHHLRELHAA